MLTSLMQSVEEGLLSFETGVQMQSCAVVATRWSFEVDFQSTLGAFSCFSDDFCPISGLAAGVLGVLA